MKQPFLLQLGKLAAVGLAGFVLAGCASTAIEQNFSSAQQTAREHYSVDLRWLTTDEARRQAQSDVETLLAEPLDGDAAVRIALAYSPSLQAITIP